MKNCITCGNAIFDTVFGDYKCRIKKVTIYDLANLDCADHKDGTPVDSKNEHEES